MKAEFHQIQFEHRFDFVIKIRRNFERGRRAAHCWPRARDDIITLTHKKEGRILVSELVGYILILLLDPRRSHGSSGSPRRARLDPRAAGDVFIKAAVQVQQPLFFSLSICALAAAAARRCGTGIQMRPNLCARVRCPGWPTSEKRARAPFVLEHPGESTSHYSEQRVSFERPARDVFRSHPGANADERGCRLANAHIKGAGMRF